MIEGKREMKEGVLLRMPLQLLVSRGRLMTGRLRSCVPPVIAMGPGNEVSWPILKPRVGKGAIWKENQVSVSNSGLKNPHRKF